MAPPAPGSKHSVQAIAASRLQSLSSSNVGENIAEPHHSVHGVHVSYGIEEGG